MNVFDIHAVFDLVRTLMTAPKGAAVTAVIDQLHRLVSNMPAGDVVLIQAMQYDSYRALTADTAVLDLQGTSTKALEIALHGADILESLREGTACTHPTLEEWDLSIVPIELQEKWWSAPDTMEEMESLLFETLEVLLQQTRSHPLTLEVLQYLVTYILALAFEDLPAEFYPRAETGRCIKLARYCTPWERTRSAVYICHKDGEVFLMDGRISSGTWQDYLSVIRQLEQAVPYHDLKRHLKDRTAQPCFDFELEKAVHFWLSHGSVQS